MPKEEKRNQAPQVVLSRLCSFYWAAHFVSLLLFSSQLRGAPLCEDFFGLGAETKSWTRSYTNNYPKLNPVKTPLSFGVEIEGLVPEILGGRIFLANAAVQFLNSKNLTTEHRIVPIRNALTEEHMFEEHRITFTFQDRPHVLIISDDHSVIPLDSYHSFEMKSFVFYTSEDRELFLELLGFLEQHAHIKSLPTSAGVHVHAGFRDTRLYEVAFVSEVFQLIEKDLRRRLHTPGSRLTFTKPTSRAVKNYLQSPYWQQDALDANAFANLFSLQDRNHALNFLALEKYNTLEFRLFNSAVSPLVVDFYLDFVMKMVSAIREQKSELLDFLDQNGRVKRISFKDFARVIDLDLKKHEQALYWIRQELKESPWRLIDWTDFILQSHPAKIVLAGSSIFWFSVLCALLTDEE